MTENQDINFTGTQRRKLWEFVRGDIEMSDFEVWLYGDGTLEMALDEGTYLDLIGCNFSNRENTLKTKKAIKLVLEVGENCRCSSVRNLDGIEMGGDWFFEKFFERQSRIAEPKTEQWWLYISRCDVCGTNWLVAQEERIHDMFYVERITDQATQEARDGVWPSRFETYANVLRIGVMLGCRKFRFVDPMAGALQVTVKDILNTQPGMPAEEIAQLLGVTCEHAQSIMEKVNESGADPYAGFHRTSH